MRPACQATASESDVPGHNEPHGYDTVFIERKADAELQRNPVVMLTTSSRNRDIERNMGLGAVAYNEKTFDPDDLNEIVGMLRGYAMGKRALSKQPYWRDGSIE